jgi:hypothetical protein
MVIERSAEVGRAAQKAVERVDCLTCSSCGAPQFLEFKNWRAMPPDLWGKLWALLVTRRLRLVGREDAEHDARRLLRGEIKR